MKFAFAFVALAAVAAPIFAMEDVEAAPAPEATPAMQARLFENLDESHYLSARGRKVSNVDESSSSAAVFAHYLSARGRKVSNVDESSSSAAVFGVAVPCVAAAVGVAGFVAYKKRQAPVQSAILSA